MEIAGNIVDIVNKNIFQGKIIIENDRIKNIIFQKNVPERYIIPGFIDAHVHIESSMLTPVAFSKLAVRQGTVGVVCDPHEIANVLGMDGIRYMKEEAGKTPLKIKIGIPSCVPATNYETSGAVLDAKQIDKLFREDKNYHLAEMMNYPGVINRDKAVMEKIEIAKKHNRIIDGHAPGVTGESLRKYVANGILTDHECSTFKEGEEKIKMGMHILIREGSAAKNFKELIPLVEKYPERVMFCTDDSHPDDLVIRHIRDMVIRSIRKGYDFWKVIRAASYNPVKFYGLPVGLLQQGDPADFIVCENLESFSLEAVYINGKKVYDGRKVVIETKGGRIINNFNARQIRKEDLQVKAEYGKKIKIILAEEGSLLTNQEMEEPKLKQGMVVADVKRDILKIVVVNRYRQATPVVGFVRGFGIKSGAIASSIAHDSHNLISVGATDEDITEAINAVIAEKGGIAARYRGKTYILSLPIAGLMTDDDGDKVAEKYKELNQIAKEMGSVLRAPFMTLSFMSLLVIPALKISDLGLFDVNRFEITSLFA